MPKVPRLSATRTVVRAIVGAVIGLGIGLLCAFLRTTHAVEGLERRLVDARTRTYIGERAADPGIVLAVFDDIDLQTLNPLGYQWPLPLDVNAAAFDWMAEAGARAVVVDVLNFDKGLAPEELDPTKPEDIRKNELELATAGRGSAETLANSYRKTGGVILGYELLQEGVPPPYPSRVRRPVFDELLSKSPRIDADPTFRRADVNLPVLLLLKAAHAVGFVNAQPDDDGITRRTTPLAALPERVVPSLPLAAGLFVTGGGAVRDGRIHLGDAEQRLDERGDFLVNFRGPADAYRKIRVVDMIQAGARLEELEDASHGKPVELPTQGTAVPDAVRGKIVIWGINASGHKDVVSVPVSDRFPGPEMQATILDNLLHGDGRVRVPRTIDLSILLGSCVLLGYLGGRYVRRGAFLATLLVMSLGLWFSGYRLFAGGWSIDLFTPTLAMLMTYAGVMAFRVLTEGRRNKWLEGTFGQYLSPVVIDALKNDPAMLELGGRRRELTIFFSDVKGFTTISEALEPDELVNLLNAYLTRQSEKVLEQDGVIDKFIGDAIMAFFGDPVPHADHALRACRAAVRCIAALNETDSVADKLGLPPLLNRIGINSGPAIVGNMGSDKRFNYTCMGDVVNLASRLEGANKAFGSRILVGPLTYERAKDDIVAKPLARLRVVGKTETVAVYELLGIRGETPEEQVKHAEAFSKAHAAVLADDLQGALGLLQEAHALQPKDGPVEWLKGIVEDLHAGRIRRPWDGSYVLDSK